MDFGLLGPLQILDDGVEVRLSGDIRRVLLATLLLENGRPVSVDRLVESCWGERAPVTAVSSLHNHVMAVRQVLRDGDGMRLQRGDSGYRIHTEPGERDVDRFTEHLRAGRAGHQSSDWAGASAELGAALALWRGEVLAGLPSRPHIEQAAAELSEQRLQAWQWRIEADLQLGRHNEVISELVRLTSAHPLREMFHSQLMLALYRAGRQSEALDAFQGLRRTLVEELGVEPSAELRDLHHRILNSDPGLAAPAGSPPPKPSGGVTLVPAQLPAAISDFAGRGPVVAQVAALVSGGGGGPGRPPLVAVIGSGGVGKTTLAVHAAHQVAEGFPDGQLYIDLRGADPAPRDPSDVLATFLRDLGVPDGSLPRVVEDRAAHYRTVLTGRRVLIVLDNVRDVAQVRPLIPAASGCAVLITSRRKLSGLAGIHCLDLGLLAAAEAATLLEGIIGAERAEAEPEAVAAIVADCAGLPLALRIAGGRLADRPTWPVSAFATRLADRHRRLDELAVSDLAIRASFDTSYAALLETDPAARHRSGADPAKVFRWAALIPAPIFGADEVSALLGRQDTDDVETALEYLVDVHLLTEHGHGRYSYHDLIRAYALERLEHAEPAEHRGRALRRLFNWYVDGVEAAARAIGRSTDLLPVLDPEPDTVPTPAFPDQDAAVAWCTRYTDALYAAADAAPGCGRPDFSLRIAVHLMGYAALDMTTDWRGCLERALKLARDEGDARAEAWILHRLGNWYALWERVEAAPTFEQALALHRAVGDSRGELWALVALAGSHTAAGRPELGIEYGKEALARYAASPDPTLRDFEVLALGTTGYACAALEQYEQAVDYYRRSLAHQRPGDRSRNHAIGLDNLGDAYRALGRYDEAVAALEKSLELSVRNSDRRGQADALHTLGRIYRQSGLADRARDCWKRSLDLSQEIDFGPGIVRASADLAALNAG